MRSVDPIEGEPWPHDMQLTIADHSHTLLELLWIREAFELRPHGEDLPPLLVDPPAVQDAADVGADTRASWENAWPRIWHAAAAHAGWEPDAGLFEELARSRDRSQERADLLHRLIGPTWRDEFDGDVFDDSFQKWSENLLVAHTMATQTALADTHERRELTALIAAWEAGLTKIVTIPCRGEFTRKVSPNALLVTDATRDDSHAYRRALGAFLEL